MRSGSYWPQTRVDIQPVNNRAALTADVATDLGGDFSMATGEHRAGLARAASSFCARGAEQPLNDATLAVTQPGRPSTRTRRPASERSPVACSTRTSALFRELGEVLFEHGQRRAGR